MTSPRTFVIAEAGVNHNGSLDMAKRLMDVAAEAGADAVKFQTFKADRIVSHDAAKADYQKVGADAAESQLDLLRRLELDADAHRALIAHAGRARVAFLSTPFDEESVDLLAGELGLEILKVPSGEITNGPLLLKIAGAGRKVILSTGMSTLGDIELALGALAFGFLGGKGAPSSDAFRAALSAGSATLAERVTLLHCTTEYPAPFDEINLRVMDTLRSAFGLPVGLSDHSVGIAVPIAAVARGAAIIEKHFTLDRGLPGPDHRASLEPVELKAMVDGIRQVEAALGDSRKMPTPAEAKNAAIARKSLVAARAIRKSEPFSAQNMTTKRPGTGLDPMRYWERLGRPADRDYQPDELLD
jgi:N-acetylneuraminate synthase